VKLSVQNQSRNQDGNIANSQEFLAQHCINHVTGFRVVLGETKVQTFRRDKDFEASDTAYKTRVRFLPLCQDGNLSFQTIAESKSK
jgi:hypothetical protein